MTTLIAVAVRDSAAGAYNRPFFVPAAGMALRSFEDETNRADPQNPMHAHPEDFELYHIGFFDEETASLTALPSPVLLVRAKDVLKPKA